MLAPDQDEARRRVRAAFAYADINQAEAQRLLSMGRSSVARLTGKKGGEIKPVAWEDLWKVADICKLPREFFGADLSKLGQILPESVPRPPRRSADDVLPAPPGDLGRDAGGSQPTDEDLGPDQRKAGEG